MIPSDLIMYVVRGTEKKNTPHFISELLKVLNIRFEG